MCLRVCERGNTICSVIHGVLSSRKSSCRHARLQITEVFVFEETWFFKVLLLQSEVQSIMGSVAGNCLSERRLMVRD